MLVKLDCPDHKWLRQWPRNKTDTPQPTHLQGLAWRKWPRDVNLTRRLERPVKSLNGFGLWLDGTKPLFRVMSRAEVGPCGSIRPPGWPKCVRCCRLDCRAEATCFRQAATQQLLPETVACRQLPVVCQKKKKKNSNEPALNISTQLWLGSDKKSWSCVLPKPQSPAHDPTRSGSFTSLKWPITRMV